MVDIVKVKQDGVQKYPQTHAKAVVGLDEQIKTVSFDPNYLLVPKHNGITLALRKKPNIFIEVL